MTVAATIVVHFGDDVAEDTAAEEDEEEDNALEELDFGE